MIQTNQKISAYSSGDLRKYEYLTGEDLGYKPSVLEKATFDYSPLGKSFTKGLTEEDKKEGLLKRQKNIEGKNEDQLEVIEDQGNKQLNSIKNINTDPKLSKTINVFSGVSPEAKNLINELKIEKETIHPEKLVCVKTDVKIFDFNILKNSLEFVSNIYHKDKNLLEENGQYGMLILLNNLRRCDPKITKIKSR